MLSNLHIRLQNARSSLRVRAALVVALPVLLLLVIFSLIHYWRELTLLEEQIRHTAVQVGEVTLGSLRHIMLEKNQHHLDQALIDVGRIENIQQVTLIDLNGRVAADSNNQTTGTIRNTTDLGCQECHVNSPETRSRATVLRASEDTLRIASPIDNEKECRSCHLASDNHLGVLLIDVSLVDTRAQLLTDLQTDLAISFGFTLLVTGGVYLLMHLFVVRRIERFSGPLEAFASGDFTARVDSPLNPRDEVDALASTFNQMATDLEHQIEQQEQRHQLRQRAIIEERERIAREIHDGVAQLMAYVNTKASAIRVFIQNQQLKEARSQLQQLEEASRESFMDVRTAILGLRTSDTQSAGLVATLQSFITKFSELTEIKIDLDLPDQSAISSLPPESELQLIRITQEALSNIQKHTSNKHAWIRLRHVNHSLELTIGDDGPGFNPKYPSEDRRPRFGLSTMRERAESIGGTFTIDSKPGTGTRITVRLPKEAK
jgi:signal transduction histidine kinase